MCGIVGHQGTFPESLIEQMTAAVAHRGPDGDGIARLNRPGACPASLGHRRLAIIDLSDAGRQPMIADPDGARGGSNGGLTLVYNGEIYNYRELRTELEAAGHRFRTRTDSEVLLHLYEQCGLQMVSRLNGIFTIAIHDARPAERPEGVEQGSLFVARDHLGVKPLYYAELPEGFLFGSEIKALLCHRGLSRAIDPAALHHMLAYLWTPAPATMLSAVRKLEPGCGLIVTDGKIVRHWRYYDPPYDGTRAPDSFEQSAEMLATRLQEAVRRQLVSDVPVGAFLSGGLDSSAIVAMARRVQPETPLTCFTISSSGGFGNDGTPDDLPYARRAAHHLGVELVEVPITPAIIKRLPEMVALLDEPQADPAPINAWLISERARAMGIPVLLSGAGGDDLFSGYRRHRALQFEQRWTWLPSAVRRRMQDIANAAASGAGLGQSTPAVRRLAKMFAYAAEERDRRLVSYFWWSTERVRRGLYSRAFADAVEGVDTAGPLLESLSRIPREQDPLQRMLFLEARHFLADHNLNYTDRSGMAVAVEVRVPLLDLDMVAFATKVPSAYKQRGRMGKAVFKRAMEPYLPREVIYRPKAGFGAPLRHWLRHDLRAMVDDTLNESGVRHRGFFDAAAVRRLVEMDRSGAIDGSYTVFALICFELWCRRFVDA
ncbi:MAG TPA: asparagine synthase (glutamine-hydrolyzing) [Vicinamibacterales bacterium]|nr:asparagine synthase (glutamine-hydrolyzing) [Vicinamibacterales bacterium]